MEERIEVAEHELQALITTAEEYKDTMYKRRMEGGG